MKRLVQHLDTLTLRMLDPASRIDSFKSLAVVDVLLGVTVLFVAAGPPQEIYYQTGIPRLWFPVLCVACAGLWRWRYPLAYMVMLLPLFIYIIGAAYIASMHGNWIDVLISAILYFNYFRRWGEVKDYHNGIIHE